MSRLFIIPCKPLARAKQRLAPMLAPDDRIRLVLAMLADVGEAAVACDQTWVLCSDEAAAEVAIRLGAAAVEDTTPDGGLNSSLRAALARAVAEGYENAIIVAADLGCIAAEDLAAVPPAAVAIAPSSDGSGTNVLALSPPDALDPAFGPASRTAHEAAARAGGFEPFILQRPRLALDVDTPDDLRHARTLGPGKATGTLMDSLGL